MEIISKSYLLLLFANIGVAECYLDEMGINIKVANELEEKRAKIYSYIYPNTEMIVGDITNKQIYNTIISTSKKHNINMIIATPPCQGMSTAGKKAIDDKKFIGYKCSKHYY